MMTWSCSLSGGWSSRITSCTNWRANVWSSIKVWSSSSAQLSWRSRSRKRGMPTFCAKRRFKAFTEPSAKSTSSKTAIDSPVTAESTSSMGQLYKKASEVQKQTWTSLICLKHLEPKVVARESHHPQDSRNSNNNSNNNKNNENNNNDTNKINNEINNW